MAKMTSPSDMMDSVTDSLKERTGKTLEEWVLAVQASGVDPLDQKAVRNWLKTEHGILQNSQWTIADATAKAAGWVRPSVEGYIDSQYQSEKANLRLIFDTLREIIEGLGEGVTVEGRGGYTPFVRYRQFAAAQASTKTRVDLGLTSSEDITEEVVGLIRLTYEQDG